MFLKLIKNELKSTFKNYLIVYLAFIITTSFLAICFTLSVPFILLYIALFIEYICVVALVIIVFFNIIKSSSKEMYGKQGFLTFSLPVSTHQLVLSKILVSIIYILLTSLTLYLSINIFAFVIKPEKFLEIINNFLKFPVNFLFSYIWTLVGFIKFICLIQCVNSVSNSSFIKKKSDGKTILLFFAMTIVLNIVLIILHVIIPYDVYFVIEANTGEIICEATSGGSYIESGYSLFELISNICISVILYFLTIYNLNKKLDL